MKDQRSRAPASVDNIYKLDGRVPVGKAIPFGLQHVLAMFVANIAPILIVTGAVKLPTEQAEGWMMEKLDSNHS